ncbi:secretin N-terminal domain-containing protein [Calycomorphotria hydatis]|uniref:Type II secretion system protein D n=1 Tax=Calycomorphotria hydatis TaxID=2528027 RepID=A0A517T5H8_9PLAN|nr:secretin N-terminal domain-containing protein [Calycomorphotria hydatis]QDT63632.1 Putative type II secretion system protein D precursor [Calycomorphotria hydatis]
MFRQSLLLREVRQCDGFVRCACHALMVAAVVCTTVLCRPLNAQEWQSQSVPQAPAAKAPAETEPHVRLNFSNQSWASVLRSIARQSDSHLVMDRAPAGRWNRTDLHKYTRAEAIRVINQQLESQNFRVLEQGAYLVVLDLSSLRARYRRPELPQNAATNDFDSSATNTRPGEPRLLQASDSTLLRRTKVSPIVTTEGIATPESIVVAGGFEEADRNTPTTSHQEARLNKNGQRDLLAVEPKGNAVKLAKELFRVFESRAKLVSKGVADLPALAVYRTPGDRDESKASTSSVKTLFDVAIDESGNKLIVSAEKQTLDSVVNLLRGFDGGQNQSGKIFQAQSTPLASDELAKRVKATLAQVSEGQPSPGFPEESPRQNPFLEQPSGTQPGPNNTTTQTTDDVNNPQLRSLVEMLRGDVSVEAVPDLGVLILRGNEADVEAVMEVVRTLEQVSRGSVPNIQLLNLQHVDSRALAELLTSVYTQLSTLRARGGDVRQTVAALPIVKPNAVILIANDDDMQPLLQLANELDQPVNPETEFEVFYLKNAVPAQVEAMLEEFYTERGGLGTRVVVTQHARTNSVIVQARPRDLDEIAALIKKIDRGGSNAVSRVAVFPLKHAVATELVDVVNATLQNAIGPPVAPTSTTGGVAATQLDQQFRDARATVLEFLARDGDTEQLVRSGILADIRVTADPRTNSLVVTAPEQSLDLVAAIIRQFDQPSDMVAEIKVFTLANSDATATAELLVNLFAENQTGQQQNALGVQVAGAADAGSGLIPLKFSVDTRTNSILAIGGVDALKIVEAIILRLDQSDIRQRKTTVIKLRNSPALDVATAINEFLQSQRDLATVDPELVSSIELLEREIIVVPEIVSNSLLISSTPRYYEEILDLVRRLDEAPAQVVIQALLVEVELQNTDEFGVELGLQDSVLFNRSVIPADGITTIAETFTSPNGVQTTTQRIVTLDAQPGFLFNNQQLGTNVTNNTSSVGTQGLTNFSLGRINGDLGFGGLVLAASSESVSVLIRALAAKRKVHILSRPQIRTLDNQLAEIQVGQQVPVVRGVTVNAVGSANPNVNIEDVGIILSVTPRINPDGTIVMETIATKSAVSDDGVPIFTDVNTGAVVESPIINISTARATVSVGNGQTIVLGGMITKRDESLERKVPWIGDLPIVGIPFRYDGVTTLRTELLIFLTPRVIRDEFDSELIKRVESERVHFIEREAEEIHGPLYAVPPPDGAFGVCPPPGQPGTDESAEYSPIIEYQDVPTDQILAPLCPGQPMLIPAAPDPESSGKTTIPPLPADESSPQVIQKRNPQPPVANPEQPPVGRTNLTP